MTAAYLVFWGPLFLVTLVHWRMEWTEARSSVTHQVLEGHSDSDDDENDNYDENIVKGTTDPRVEFILPKQLLEVISLRYQKFKHKS